MSCNMDKYLLKEGCIVKFKNKGRSDVNEGTICFAHFLFDEEIWAGTIPPINLHYIDKDSRAKIGSTTIENIELYELPLKYKRKIGKKVLLNNPVIAVYTVNLLENGHQGVTGQRLLKHRFYLGCFIETMVEHGLQLQSEDDFKLVEMNMPPIPDD